jgi:pimeloyl-ACP methyl ester carboxylesterase
MSNSIYKTQEGEKEVMALYDSFLARWPVPYETVTLPTRHGKTFAIVSGNQSDPPLLLLHGAGSNAIMWGGDVEAYSQHYRVYAVDLPGEPGKSAQNRPDWDGPGFAEWLEDVLDGLQLEKATLIGLSQGGWTALKFAVYQPERVEKLVLLTPGGIVPDRLSFILRVIPLSLLGRWGRRRINQLVLAGQRVDPETDEAMMLITSHFKPRVGTLPIFTDAELRRLTMPVLLLVGAKDALRDGEKIAARLRGLLPQVTTTMIPDGGHALLDTTGRILPFLRPEERVAKQYA